MTLRTGMLAAGAAGFVALIAFFARPRPGALVAKYICSPVPEGVRELYFATNDRFGIAMEWAGHLSFTAPSEVMRAVIERSGFQPSSVEFASSAPSGPQDWRSVTTLGPQARVYFRVHRPSRDGRGLRISQNRRWSEILWIDETGTNAFLTMWDID